MTGSGTGWRRSHSGSATTIPTPEIPPRKPKWMRLATYDRLLETWHDAAERRDDIYDTKIAGFLARGARLGG